MTRSDAVVTIGSACTTVSAYIGRGDAGVKREVRKDALANQGVGSCRVRG
jgi:hypothetical protein